MADLRGLSQAADSLGTPSGNYQQTPVVSTPSPYADGINQAANWLSMGARSMASAAKVEANSAVNNAVAGMTDELLAAQNAASHDPKFDLQATQRKILKKWNKNSPQATDKLLTAFNKATGIEAAGETEEQKMYRVQLEEAYKARYVTPDMTPEQQEKGVKAYNDLVRQQTDWKVKTEKNAALLNQGKISDREARIRMIKDSRDMANTHYSAMNNLMENDLIDLQTGKKTLDQVQREWKLKQIELTKDMNQLGDFANDPTVVAMLKPVNDLFQFASDSFNKQFKIDAAKKQIEAINTRASWIVHGDANTVLQSAASKMFNYQVPGMMTDATAYVNTLMKEGPKDLRDSDEYHIFNIAETLKNMSQSEDKDAKDEAKNIVVDISKHLERNGEDYSAGEVDKTLTALDNPFAFQQMTPEEKDHAANAVSMFAVDKADNSLREIQNSSTLKVAPFTSTGFNGLSVNNYTPSFMGDKEVPLDKFAKLTSDNSGAHYEVADEYKLDRQARMMVASINKKLQPVNKVARVYSYIKGITVEQANNLLFGIGGDADKQGIEPTPESTPEVESTPKAEPEVKAEPQLSDAMERTMQHENSVKAGWDGEKWKPHKSVEGGTDTLAYGHKLTASEAKSGKVKIDGKAVNYNEGLTQEQAESLFKQDWDVAVKEGEKVIGSTDIPEINDVISEMSYQLGAKKLSGFKEFKAAIASGDYNKAADEMLDSVWAKEQVPERAKKLSDIIRSHAGDR